MTYIVFLWRSRWHRLRARKYCLCMENSISHKNVFTTKGHVLSFFKIIFHQKTTPAGLHSRNKAFFYKKQCFLRNLCINVEHLGFLYLSWHFVAWLFLIFGPSCHSCATVCWNCVALYWCQACDQDKTGQHRWNQAQFCQFWIDFERGNTMIRRFC